MSSIPGLDEASAEGMARNIFGFGGAGKKGSGVGDPAKGSIEFEYAKTEAKKLGIMANEVAGSFSELNNNLQVTLELMKHLPEFLKFDADKQSAIMQSMKTITGTKSTTDLWGEATRDYNKAEEAKIAAAQRKERLHPGKLGGR
jgi:hypothetical protein